MAVGAYAEIPFGVRDCAIYALTGDVAATGIDVPRIRKVDFKVDRSSAELEGDDVTIAVQTFAKKMTGSIESGGINFAVLAILEGGSAGSESGTGSAHQNTYAVRGTDVEGYFKLTAKSIANDGGVLFMTVYKVKATSGPTYNFEHGNFALTQCDLQAIFNGQTPSKLYDLIAYESASQAISLTGG